MSKFGFTIPLEISKCLFHRPQATAETSFVVNAYYFVKVVLSKQYYLETKHRSGDRSLS